MISILRKPPNGLRLSMKSSSGRSDRAQYLLEHLMERAANLGVRVPLRWKPPTSTPFLPKNKYLIRGTGDRMAHQVSGTLECARHGSAGQ